MVGRRVKEGYGVRDVADRRAENEARMGWKMVGVEKRNRARVVGREERWWWQGGRVVKGLVEGYRKKRLMCGK